MHGISRRALLAATTGGILVARAALADSWAVDVGLYAEPSLAPALRAVGRRFTAQTGAGVSVLTAPPMLLLEQIQHNAAHDVLIVPAATMDDAEKRGFVTHGSRRDVWKNPLVIATAGKASETGLAALLAAGPIAVCDPTEASSLDGQSVLKTIAPDASTKIIGVAATADAADMVLSGAAHSALLYLTDVRSRKGLSVALALEGVPAVSLAFALNPHPPSKNATAFAAFLTAPENATLLHEAGLEIAV